MPRKGEKLPSMSANARLERFIEYHKNYLLSDEAVKLREIVAIARNEERVKIERRWGGLNA